MKLCNKCDKLKEDDEFYKNTKTPDGREYSCKECRKEYLLQNYLFKYHRDSEWRAAELQRCRIKDHRRDKKEERRKAKARLLSSDPTTA